MGILNLTPDSFSDGGDLAGGPAAVVACARSMLEGGASILDLGAVSTRPGAASVSLQEEMDRLMPALDALQAAGLGPLSIDTYRPEVAEAALQRGASMINDVKAATVPGMIEVLRHYRPQVCLMHMKGVPQTMQEGSIHYDDVVEEVGHWLRGRVEDLALEREHVFVDPGIGFGKLDEHNLALTRGIRRLAQITGCRVLYGASRKSLIGRIAGVERPKERLPGSLALAGAATEGGAAVLRVHDVAETIQYLRLRQALAGSTAEEF
ncbi:MAG: dihydropteroate synthase [Myxococcota bacterium]|nr:dihydropteroate synthase [Myxococcota bacterium]